MSDEKKTVQSLLYRGIEAARNGEVTQAQTDLTAVLTQEPNNIPALMWLAFIATEPQKSIALLKRVLSLDPDNEQAQAGMRWAEARLKTATEEEPSAEPPEDEPEQEDFDPVNLRQQLFTKGSLDNGRKSVFAHRARRNINPFLLILIVAIGASALISAGIKTATLQAAAPAPPKRAPIYQLAAAAHEGLLQPHADAGQTTHPDSPVRYNASASDSLALVDVDFKVDFAYQSPPEIAALQASSATKLTALIGPDLTHVGPELFQPVADSLLAHQPNYPNEKWIEVDIGRQRVTAWEGNVPVMSFLASTGLDETPTILGKYHIYWKLESTTMSGADYHLPEVPYTMYFQDDFGLHGTYWHDNFGQPMSRGCVNLKTTDAAQLFEWAGPVIPPNSDQVISSWHNPGTLVVVHE